MLKLDARKVLSWLNPASFTWLLVYAVIWLSLGWLATNVAEKQILSTLGETALHSAKPRILQLIQAQDLRQGFDAELTQKLDGEMADIRDNSHIAELKIVDRQGRVQYTSDNRFEAGDPPGMRLAWGIVTQHLSNGSYAIFQPVEMEGGENGGTLIFYTPTSCEWGSLINKFRLVVWAFIISSSLLMLAAFDVLIKRASSTIESKNKDVDKLSKRLAESRAFISQTSAGTISALLKALDVKDRYTASHSYNVASYAWQIGLRLGLDSAQLSTLETAAILHDIGKIGVPEHILNKRGFLDNSEFELVKKHAEIGAQIIHSIYFLEDVSEIVMHHHERYDGKGYPHGLKEEQIPLSSRILSVADVFDALATDRPYRQAMSKAKAKNVIEQGSGTQFDPQVVRAFLEFIESGEAA